MPGERNAELVEVGTFAIERPGHGIEEWCDAEVRADADVIAETDSDRSGNGNRVRCPDERVSQFRTFAEVHFSMEALRVQARSVVVHIPHASRLVPDEFRSSLRLDDAALAQELLYMTDAYTDELFAMPGATAVRFAASRLVVDPERFCDDALEPMASRGMGVIYTRCAHGQPLRDTPTGAERSMLLDRWYWPHHERLTQAVDNALSTHGHCLVLDAHSFPSAPLPYELDQAHDRPQICIGSDAFHTPPSLLAVAIETFRRHGFSVEVDRPFSGALVPLAHYQRDARVSALMIEVRRDLYMDEHSGARRADFASVADQVQQAARAIIDAFESRRGDARDLASR